MKEAIVLFGESSRLVGTLTSPDAATRKPAILLFNAGVLHRVGPHRINVKLARHLCGLGYTTLRFDLSGQGDSMASRSARPYQTQAIIDIQSAMDAVSDSTGISNFVVAGICSGANNALAAALHDERIIGLILIDGHVYTNWLGRFTHYARRMVTRSPVAVLNAALSKLRPSDADKLRAAEPDATEFDTATLSRKEFARSLQALVDHGTDIFLLYTASWSPHYSYSSQLRHVFRRHSFVNRVECHFAPQFDHTFTLIQSQRALADWIGWWLTNSNTDTRHES